MEAVRRAYDHRLRELARGDCDPRLLAQLRIPRSTVATWRRRLPHPVVALDASANEERLRAEVLQLRQRNRLLLTIIRLLFLLLRLTGARLDQVDLPGAAKASLLAAIGRAQKTLALAAILRLLKLSPSRYHAWQQRARLCQLDDRSSCPRTHPNQVTPAEVTAMRDMVHDTSLRHMTLRALVLHAQRLGKVFASAATWARLIRARGWKRPRSILHHRTADEGVRASRPNEYWHVDVTILRLADGTRVYVQAVIDNFSRRILAWKATLKMGAQTTCEVLSEAGRFLSGDGPTNLVTDAGSENVNETAEALHSGTLAVSRMPY